MIRTEGLTKYYGDFCALKDLTINIEKGQIFGYIGPNGAGKTTTIRILAGLLRPTEGHGYVGEFDVSRHPRRVKSLIGYLPDFFGVYVGMRVEEYLDFFGAAFKIPRKQRRKRIDHVLEVTGSTYMKDLFVEALSRGMKQRIGIARTLIHDPSTLLLDEPLSGLDPKARIEMRSLLRRLGEMGKTVLVSSHILPELGSLCDTVGMLEQGRLLTYGPLDEVVHGVRHNRLVEIQLLNNAAGAGELLKAMPESSGVSDVRRDGNLIRFEWSGADGLLSELLAAMVNKGFRVLWFREVPLNLEEAFMRLTAAAAEGGGATMSPAGKAASEG